MNKRLRIILLCSGIFLVAAFNVATNLEYGEIQPLRLSRPRLPQGIVPVNLPIPPSDEALLSSIDKYVYINGNCVPNSYAILAELTNSNHLYQLCWWISPQLSKPLPILLGEITLLPDALSAFQAENYFTERENVVVQVKNPPRDSTLSQQELPQIKYESMRSETEGGPNVIESPAFLVKIDTLEDKNQSQTSTPEQVS